MGVSIETVRKAKVQLLAELQGREWLRGVGIARTPRGAKVRVNVTHLSDDVRAAVPTTVGAVQVELVVVGEITAQPTPTQAKREHDPQLRDKLLAGLKAG